MPNIATDSQSFDDMFLGELSAAINKAASKGEWDTRHITLAQAYAISLVKGRGDMPPQLKDMRIIRTVWNRFALGCAKHKVPDGRYPGQKLRWYPARFASAQAYLQNRKSG